jgi:hypothetical protein
MELINSINFDGWKPKNTSMDRFKLMSQAAEGGLRVESKVSRMGKLNGFSPRRR